MPALRRHRSALPRSSGRRSAACRTADSFGEQFLELGRSQLGSELFEGALPGIFVGPPTQEPGAVAEASAGDLVVPYLDHEPGLQRLPLRGALGVPAARAAWGASGETGRFDQRLELFRQRGPLPGRNCGGEADVVEQSVVPVEPEQQRTDFLLLFRIAEAADDAVSGALLFDFDHRPLARAVVLVGALGDHAVERAAAALEPAERDVAVAGHWRQLETWRHVGTKETLQLLAASRERFGGEILAVELEKVEHHQLRRSFVRQLAHAALGRMQPQLQRLERQNIGDGDDQLAVEQE